MASVSFWARQDSITANNNVLNPIGNAGTPATLITFTNDDPDIAGVDRSGDLILDYNGGLTDPDTSIVINGVSYPFTFVLIGTLPTSGQGIQQVPLEHRGDDVALITVIIGGQTVEYFFVLDGSGTATSMSGFGAGAITLSNIITTPPPTPVCFCAGTEIATPSGPCRVERLRAGDHVLTDTGESRQVMWVGQTRITLAQLRANPDLRPIRIAAGAFGACAPCSDLDVSPQHRILVDGPLPAFLFGEDRVLAPAKHFVGTLAKRVEPEADVVYYHVMLADHDMVLSNGLATESFQPARRTLDAMSPEAQRILVETLKALGMEAMLTRKDAFTSLKRGEAELLADRIASGVTRGPAPASQQNLVLHDA